MSELSLIPATKEFCENADIVLAYSREEEYIDNVRCLYYPEVSSIIQTCSFLFSKTNIKELDFSRYDFRNVTTFENMFYESKVERVVALSCSAKCTSFRYLCAHCSNLKEFDASELNIKRIQNMNRMFFYCGNLTRLRLPDMNKSPECHGGLFRSVPKSAVEELNNVWKTLYEETYE